MRRGSVGNRKRRGRENRTVLQFNVLSCLLLIHVQNSGGPFTLALQPDNSLSGSGSTIINGRLITGMNGDNVTFAPHAETCDVSRFNPKIGAMATTSVATAPTAPAPAAPADSAATTASTPATVGGATVKLTIISPFPAGANPLAGTGVTLMSERFDVVLRKVGAPIAAEITPGKAVQALCRKLFSAEELPRLYTCNSAVLRSQGKVRQRR